MRIATFFLLLMTNIGWSKNLECNARVADINYHVKIEEYADLKSKELRVFKNDLLLKRCLLISPTSRKLERNGVKKEVIKYLKTECADIVSNRISLKDYITLVVTERSKKKSYHLHFENSLDGVVCN
jgi:hypothetical protein